MKRLFILVGALAIGGGVYMWGKYQSELAKKLAFGLKNARVKRINTNQILLDFDLQIDNPTEISLDVSDIDIDVFANDKLASNILLKTPTLLTPKSHILIPLTLNFNPRVIFSDLGFLLDIVGNMNDVRLRFKGTIKVRKFGIRIPVPFTFETTYGQLKNN